MLSILSSKKTATAPPVAAVANRQAVEPPRAPAAGHTPDTGAPEPDVHLNPSGRKAKRLPASALPAITGVRISPRGIGASLVNMSSTGLLVECGDRLQTGIKVVINLDGTFSPAQIRGTVVRNYVASVSAAGGLVYHVAVSFAEPIRLDVDSEAPPAAAAVPQPRKVVRNRW